MANQPIPMNGLMTAMPRETRGRILSGMRWTLWLSGLAVPFGFGTSLILARTSPEAIGTYGLLSVYLSVVTSLFYLGGDTVVIKFVPMLDGESRLSFLLSYFSVICLAFVGWMTFAFVWPEKLHYLFGTHANSGFSLWILLAAPVYIAFSIIAATLKGMLEMRWAQILLRLITIGSFLTYATFFTFLRGILAAHYEILIWSVYLGLVGIGAVVGGRHLIRSNRWNRVRRLRFFLPRGFWRYMLATQQLSVLSFLSGRLDYILILNFGGLGTLGKYVAVSTVGSVIPVVNSLFVDTVMPSLTNLVATENSEGAAEVVALYLRILFAVTAAVTCCLMLSANILTMLFGPKYAGLQVPVVVLVLFFGLSAPGGAGGLLLSAVGKQQAAVWVTLGQVVSFVGLFYLLWPRFQLVGAILAYGSAELIFYFLQLLIAQRLVPIRFTFGREYGSFALVALAAAALAAWTKLGVAAALLGWVVAMAGFLLLAGYSLRECIALTKCFIPNSALAVWTERKEQYARQ